jgi:alpha-ketoglutarate-dependent taurine dioxygenase
LEAFAYQDVPFEVLVKELRPKKRLSETPFFQVLFVLQNAPTPVLELPGLRLSGVDVGPSMSKFDLGVFVRESENGLRTTWSYKRTVLGQAGVAELAEKFVRVLERVSLEPEERLSALRAMGDLEPSASGSASPETEGRTMSSLRSIRRKAVDLTVTPAVAKGYLTEGQRLPLVVQPTTAGVDLADWLGTNRQTVDQDLLVHGAILLRGFGITQVDAFEAVATAVCGELYGDYGDLPHEGQSRDIYQSTPYPADREILFHNESSHMHCWPLKQLFCCLKAAAVGGETPIVDCRRVYQLLDPQVRREFCRRGLRYVRNFTEGLDVSWQQFFSTDDRSVAEDFCRRMGIGLEWTERGARIWQCAPAVARHPRTGETSFFNQAQLHHLFFLEAAVRESMLAMFKQEELPRNVYYGDGGEIEDEVMKRIGDLYHEQASSFPWLEGDVLLLDNMLVAHSRRPFEGERKILVALGEVFYKQDLQDVVA